MNLRLFYRLGFSSAILAAMILTACTQASPSPTAQISHTPASLPATQSPPVSPPTKRATSEAASTATVAPTIIVTPSPIPTSIYTPLLHQGSSAFYDTLFTLPVGGGSSIQYEYSGCCINGPNALAVLPDGTFLISDMVTGKRLLHYSLTGELLGQIPLNRQKILWVYRLQVRNGSLFLLTRDVQDAYAVYEMTLDGQIKQHYPFSGKFPIGESNLLEQGLTGMLIDCEQNILLEVVGGSKLYRLVDIQADIQASKLINGFSCRGQFYHAQPSQTPDFRSFAVGGTIISTHVSQQFGSLSLLGGFADGSLLLLRGDVISDPVIHADLTVHFVDPGGLNPAMARVPIAELYYTEYITGSIALSEQGEVFALLPREDTLSLIRLNFYPQLEPFMPGAVAPQVTISTSPP